MARRTRPVLTLLAATAALATVCCLSSAASGATVPGRTTARPPGGCSGCSGRDAGRGATVAPAGTNLLANGDAESGASSFRGYDEVIVPGWPVTEGLPTVVRYGVKALLQRTAPGPADRGKGYFAGGIGRHRRCSSRTCRWRRRAAARSRPAPRVTVDGWLGGLASSERQPVGPVDLPRPRRRHALDGDARTGHARRRATTPPRCCTRPVRVAVPAGHDRRAGLARHDHAGHELRRVERQRDGQQPGLGGRPVADRLGARPSAGPADTADRDGAGLRPRLRRDDGEPGLRGHHRQHPSGAVPQQPAARRARRSASMYAEVHPSDPNYLALSAGLDVPGDGQPDRGQPRLHHRRPQHRRPGRGRRQDLAGVLPERERSVRQHDPRSRTTTTTCRSSTSRTSAATPRAARATWSRCRRWRPTWRSTATTPNFVWWGADDCSDMEGCGIKAGDTFLKQTDRRRSSPRRPGRPSARCSFVTFDEDRYDKERPAQLIPTIALASTGVKAGLHEHRALRPLQPAAHHRGVLGLGTLTANDLYAEPMADIFVGG